MRINLQDDEAVEVQMAPLIDCVFLLLIFFLLATTMKKTEKQLPVTLPFSGASIEQKEDPGVLVLGVDKAGLWYIGAERVSNDMLLKKIREAAARKQPVRIDGDEAARWSDVVQLIELCQFEGIRNVGFHTRPEKKY